MRIRICAQCQNWHMLRARRCPPSGLHMQHPKHMGSREESMQRHNPMVDMGSRMDFPPHPIPTVKLEPCAPSVSCSAPGTAPLTLHVWHRPPSNSGWKVAGFLLPQDRQLSERQRAPLTQGSGCSSPPGAQGTTRSAHPAQDLRLQNRAGNARSLLPRCGQVLAQLWLPQGGSEQLVHENKQRPMDLQHHPCFCTVHFRRDCQVLSSAALRHPHPQAPYQDRTGKRLPSRLPLLFVTSETICSL